MERKQSTRCTKVWNRIKGEVNKSRTDEEFVKRKNEIRKSKEHYKRTNVKNRQ